VPAFAGVPLIVAVLVPGVKVRPVGIPPLVHVYGVVPPLAVSV
jgi:hypothetical protein